MTAPPALDPSPSRTADLNQSPSKATATVTSSQKAATFRTEAAMPRRPGPRHTSVLCPAGARTSGQAWGRRSSAFFPEFQGSCLGTGKWDKLEEAGIRGGR